ncbi:MAG: hypothetical protein RLZZ511_3862 [Cyanobacteriota bacterium]|jgi:uncharacterized phage-associated protein
MSVPKLFPALEVANYFLDFANEMGRSLNLAKLQYLVYYAQAWHLAMYDQPIFADEIGATPNGPMIVAVQTAYAEFGEQPIVATVQVNFSPEIAAYLHAIVREYFDLELSELADGLANEVPWQQAIAAGVIDLDQVRDYYRTQLIDA